MIPIENTLERPCQASNIENLCWSIKAGLREAGAATNGKGAIFSGHYGGIISAVGNVMMHRRCRRCILILCEWGEARKVNCMRILRVPT